MKLFKFAHEPGSGATTIAMNVLWNLRNDFRCVRIDALDASAIADVAEQITGYLLSLVYVLKIVKTLKY